MNACEQTINLWFVRHGKTMFNTAQRVQGWSDTPLTPPGRDIVIALAKGLQSIKFDGMYSSDSGRARETLSIVARANRFIPSKLQEDWRLREINFGSYEGEMEVVMWNEMAKAANLSLEQWRSSVTPAGYVDTMMQLERKRSAQESDKGQSWPAESHHQVLERLLQVTNEIIQKHQDGSNILIVMHGGSIAILLAALVSVQAKGIIHIDNASVSRLCYDANAGFSLVSMNDMSYVEASKTS